MPPNECYNKGEIKRSRGVNEITKPLSLYTFHTHTKKMLCEIHIVALFCSLVRVSEITEALIN